MFTEVNDLLDEKINEVFYEMQKKFGIESGDISPMDAFELDEITKKLTKHIVKVLETQK